MTTAEQESAQESASAFDEAVERTVQANAWRYATILGWAAVTIYPAWVVLDYVSAPTLWPWFAAVRFTFAAIFAATLLTTRRRGMRPEIMCHVLFFGIALHLSVACAIVPRAAMPLYYLGFSALFLAVGTVALWKPVHMAVQYLATFTMLAVFHATLGNASFTDVLFNGGLLLFTLATVSLFFSKVRYDMAVSQLRTQLMVDRAADQLRRQNVRLDEQNRQLVDLNTEKNEFLGIVAHDLKNPLTVIMGLSQMLVAHANELEPAQVTALGQRVHGSARGMLDLANHLLDVNTLDQGSLKLHREQFALAPLVQRIVEEYQPRAAAKQIGLLVIADPQVHAFADPVATTQVIDNLVSNAVKYAPPGSQVQVRVLLHSDAARCEVSDAGPGLSASDRELLFGAVPRLPTRPAGDEHGLGLAIARKLVEAMRGRIFCESDFGNGATFVIELASHAPDRHGTTS